MSQPAEDCSNLVSSFIAAANTYDRRIARATKAVAAHLPPLLAPLPPKPVVLDNACGTGAVTIELIKVVPGVCIHAVDASRGMIDILQAAVEKNGWRGSVVQAAVMDGQHLDFGDEIFDASIMNFGIFFFPDPVEGMREVFRTLKTGGVAVVTCWKEKGFFPVFYEVQKAVEPASPITSFPTFENWMEKKTLEDTMMQAGFVDVRVESREVLLWGEGLAELASCLAENMEILVGSQWSEAEKGKLLEVTERVLGESRQRFCVELEGKIGVKMVAWIAISRK
jgi:ubiquinone/menaquinone biosynthesis C-methylase UbiE